MNHPGGSMNPALDSRARFEAHFSQPPYEFDVYRWPMDDIKAPWPGSYREYPVQCAWEAWQAAIASMAVIDPETGSMAQAYRDLIEGMSVSVDVSTGDDDAGHRYFGTITEVMDDPYDKHHVTLLVQDAAPNFNTNPVLAALAAKETT